MYAFVEVTTEMPDDTNWGQIRFERDGLTAALAPLPVNELPPKEWDKFLENWLLGEPNHTETIEKMSPQQRKLYNDLKRAKNRLKDYKDNE